MNRRSLIKNFLGLSGAAAAAVIPVTAAPVETKSLHEDAPAPNQPMIYIDSSMLAWKVTWTGWKPLHQSDVLVAQALAWPINDDGARDPYRPLLYQNSGGVGGPYNPGDVFNVCQSLDLPYITVSSTREEKLAAERQTAKRLVALIEKVAKIDWHKKIPNNNAYGEAHVWPISKIDCWHSDPFRRLLS